MQPTRPLVFGSACRAVSRCVRVRDRSEQAFALRQLAAELAATRPEFAGTPVHRLLARLADLLPSAATPELVQVAEDADTIAAGPAAGTLARSIAGALVVFLWTECDRTDAALAAYPRALGLADAALADALRRYPADPRPYSVLDAATGRAEDALSLAAALGLDVQSLAAGCATIDSAFVSQWRNVQPLAAGDRPSKDDCEFVPRAQPGDLDAVWHELRLRMQPGERVLWFVHSFERSAVATTERVVVFRKGSERTRFEARHDVPLWAIQDVDYRCEWMDYYVRFVDSRTGSAVKLNFKPDQWKAAHICQRLRALTARPALGSEAGAEVGRVESLLP